MSIDESVIKILVRAGEPFWLAGGRALDLFLGRETRKHEDLDIGIMRKDQLAFQKALSGWDLRAADPPGSGSLLPWPEGHYYELPIHNIWCRENENANWGLELLFTEFDGDEWVYRRNSQIRGPLESYFWKTEEGLLVIAPEIQLLYKSRNLREKDELDFANCLPELDSEQKERLRGWIEIDSGANHTWLTSEL